MKLNNLTIEKSKCPECRSKDIWKKGFRKNKREELQIYQCKKCGKRFTLKKMLNKSYPVNVILNSVSYYNKGMTLEESSKKVNSKFGVKTYPRLISSWLNEFSDICTFRRFRNKLKEKREGSKSGFSEPVFEKLFEHKQPYLFKYHKLKVEMFLTNYFEGLGDYLSRVVSECPYKLFLKDNLRSSQSRLKYDFIKNLGISKKYNYACKVSELALKMCRTNKERHEIVQDFMLINDTSTVGVEVPIWLSKEEVEEIDKLGVFEFGRDGNFNNTGNLYINKISSQAEDEDQSLDKLRVTNKLAEHPDEVGCGERGGSGDKITNKSEQINNSITLQEITGHIDIVQARFGIIYVLDYKPNAVKEKKEKVVSQLFTYALALSVRTGIWLRNFRCAWFDDKNYYEFNPCEVVINALVIRGERGLGREFTDKEFRKFFSELREKRPEYFLNKGAKWYYTSLRYHDKREKEREWFGREKENWEKRVEKDCIRVIEVKEKKRKGLGVEGGAIIMDGNKVMRKESGR